MRLEIHSDWIIFAGNFRRPVNFCMASHVSSIQTTGCCFLSHDFSVWKAKQPDKPSWMSWKLTGLQHLFIIFSLKEELYKWPKNFCFFLLICKFRCPLIFRSIRRRIWWGKNLRFLLPVLPLDYPSHIWLPSLRFCLFCLPAFLHLS